MSEFIDNLQGFLDTVGLWVHNFCELFEYGLNFLYELINLPLDLLGFVPPLLGLSVGLTLIIFVIRFLLLK